MSRENDDTRRALLVLSFIVSIIIGVAMVGWVMADKPDDFAFAQLTYFDENISKPDIAAFDTGNPGKAARQREILATLEYRAFRERHKRDVFLSQLWATTTIVRVSVLTTITGVVLVLCQFVFSSIAGGRIEESALELGPQGLKIRTAFIGFLMIAFGLFFWQAFLARAYTIRDISDKENRTAAERAAPDPEEN